MFKSIGTSVTECGGRQPGAIAVSPIVAAKLALYTAMRRQGISKTALAERLGLSESAVRMLVDPDHHSHISNVEAALRAVGRSLVVGDRTV